MYPLVVRTLSVQELAHENARLQAEGEALRAQSRALDIQLGLLKAENGAREPPKKPSQIATRGPPGGPTETDSGLAARHFPTRTLSASGSR